MKHPVLTHHRYVLANGKLHGWIAFSKPAEKRLGGGFYKTLDPVVFHNCPGCA
jgi:hypothetical protein